MNFTLSAINIYPIKSCRGISAESWQLEERGLRLDRRWMIVDDEGVFISQRDFPRLALVSVSEKSDSLRVDAPGMDTLIVPFDAATEEHIPVVIWDDGVEARPVGAGPSDWFSDYLGFSCRLVTMTKRSVRFVDQEFALNGDVVSFADGFPLLLISEGSLADLNSRLDSPVSMKRFRPNLVVGGCEPYAEDGWKEITIGDVRLHVVKPCARCVITTVDPETGERGLEPLSTLSTFRAIGNKVLFGQNAIHANNGTLRVGDTVRVV